MQGDHWLAGNSSDISSTLYELQGYQNRTDYLIGLANKFGVNSDEVIRLANMLGEDDDFDGLILTLEEYQGVMRMRYRQLQKEQALHSKTKVQSQDDSES